MEARYLSVQRAGPQNKVLFYFPASEVFDKYSCDLKELVLGVCLVYHPIPLTQK